MEFENMKLKVYLGNHELSHLFRAKCSLEEDLQIKLEREAELQGLCLLKWKGVGLSLSPWKASKGFGGGWFNQSVEVPAFTPHISWVGWGGIKAGDGGNGLGKREAEFEWGDSEKLRVDMNTWENFGWGSKEREGWTLLPLTESEFWTVWDGLWRHCVQYRYLIAFFSLNICCMSLYLLVFIYLLDFKCFRKHVSDNFKSSMFLGTHPSCLSWMTDYLESLRIWRLPSLREWSDLPVSSHSCSWDWQ